MWTIWTCFKSGNEEYNALCQNNFFCEDSDGWILLFHLFQNLSKTINEITATFFFSGIYDVLNMEK